MSKNLKISVVMPSFNQGQFLEKSIRSVVEQDYPTLEFIVVDGGSSDESIDIIRQFQNSIDYWHSKPDGGQSDAINQGMNIATGEILCWLNSDDLHQKDTLATVNSYFLKNSECDWLVGAGQFVDITGQPIWPEQLPNSIARQTMADWYNNMFHQPSVFWRRSLWEQAGPLDEHFDFAMDFELWLRFLKISIPHRVEHLLSQATDHAEMKTRAGFEKGYAEFCHALFLNGFDSEGRWAVEKLARKVYFFKKVLYPISRMQPVRMLNYRLRRYF